jgi:NADP-dependent alcohol dehydrogenase
MWAATQALNGLIGAGVPQDWATHMLGHELTAMHGLDHAQTLALCCLRCGMKNAIPSAPNCCNTQNASGISPKVLKMRVSMPPSKQPVVSLTRLSGYGLDGSSIPALLAKLEEHGMTQLGEHQDITLDVSRRIYEAAR